MTPRGSSRLTNCRLIDAEFFAANSRRRFRTNYKNITFLLLTSSLFGMSHAQSDCSAVLLTDSLVPENVVNLGEIEAGAYAANPKMCRRDQVIQELKRQACEMGGTAIRVVSEKGPGLMRSCYSITAMVLDTKAPGSSSSLSLENLRSLAERGETSAQHILGMEYLSGGRLQSDQVEAYAWLNIAASQNHEAAVRQRDELERVLSIDQLRQAQTRSVDIWTSYYGVSN